MIRACAIRNKKLPTSSIATKCRYSTNGNPDKFPKSPSLQQTVASTSNPAEGTTTAEGSKVNSAGGSSGKLLLFSAVIGVPVAVAVVAKRNPEWTPTIMEGRDEWKKFHKLLGIDDKMKQESAKHATKVSSTTISVPESKQQMKKVEDATKTKDDARKKLGEPINAADKSSVSPIPLVPPKSQQQQLERKSTTQKVKSSSVVTVPVKSQAVPDKETASSTTEKQPKLDELPSDKPSKEGKGSNVQDVAKTSKKPSTLPAEQPSRKTNPEPTNSKAAPVNANQKASPAPTKVGTANAVGAVVPKPDSPKQSEGKLDKKVKSEPTRQENIAKEKAAIDTLIADIDQLEDRARKMQSAKMDTLMEELRSESDSFQHEVERRLLTDLEKCDPADLRVRIVQLISEMKSRTKWEAFRMMELLRKVENDAAEQNVKVLKEAEKKYASLIMREKRLLEEQLNEKHRNNVDNIHKTYLQKIEDAVEFHKKKHAEELQRKLDQQHEKVRAHYDSQLTAKLEENVAKSNKERIDRLAELENLRFQVQALSSVFESSSNYEAFSHQVHKVSVATLALANQLERQTPLHAELSALRQAGRGDYLIEAVLDTLPASISNQGAPTLSQLEDRFKTVRKVCHRAALVPENTGPVGHAFGYALSWLMLPPYGPIDGAAPDAVLSRISHELSEGNLTAVLDETKNLKGLPAEAISDFASDVKSRILVDQAISVIKSHVALLAASCS